MNQEKNRNRIGDPQEVYERHRGTLEKHAASDSQSAWLAEALLRHIEDAENGECSR